MVEVIKPQGRRIPEGTYVFRFQEDLSYDDMFYKNKDGVEEKGKKAHLILSALGENAEFDFEEAFPVWDQKYTDLLKALGIEHGSDVDFTGMTFEAEIKYIAGTKNPNRSWPHIVNVRATEKDRSDDETPF